MSLEVSFYVRLYSDIYACVLPKISMYIGGAMKIEDIPAGESWACRFKTTTFVDENGNAVQDLNLKCLLMTVGTLRL